MKLQHLPLLAICCLCLVGGNAFAASTYGKKIPDEVVRTTLSALTANPIAFDGKDVVVEGWFAGMCSDGEDFYFKDKTEIVEADPPSAEVMKIKRGTKLKLYGHVKVSHVTATDKGHPRIVGMGVEVLP